MERQICEEDGVTRRKAQEILRPRDNNMRYVMAILQMGEKHDVMGRSRRVTMVVDYNEQRVYTKQSREGDEIQGDNGRIHNISKWGWRVYEAMSSW